MDKLTLAPAWRRALPALLALWAATLWLHRDTLVAMVTIWDRSETFAHAWVVPPITAWLVWRQRAQVLALTPRPALWVLLPMALLGMLWLSAELVAVATATQFALVALLVLAVPALLGLQVARVLMFPLGFLFFCVPAGEFLTPSLMHWTAEITIWALRATGIPVYQEGLQFVIPSGSWSVVEACSGIRYLIASIMVGTLFAYLNYTSNARRWLFVGISILVPLAANWLRAYMIVMLGHLSGNQLAVGADHLVYGWVLFGIIIMLLYWIGARWAQVPAEPPAFTPAGGQWPLGSGAIVAVLGAVLVALPLWAWQRAEAQLSDAPVALDMPLQLPGGWQRDGDLATAWEPAFSAASATSRHAYRRADGQVVGVYVGYYRHQDEKRKLVSSSNRLVRAESHAWNLLSTRPRDVPLAGAALRVRESKLLQLGAPGTARQRLRVWQTYWIDGAYVAGDVAAKLKAALGRLRGRSDDSAVLLLFSDDPEGAQTADTALTAFVTEALPTLASAVDAPRRALLAP